MHKGLSEEKQRYTAKSPKTWSQQEGSGRSYGPLVDGPQRYRDLICSVIVREENSDWRIQARSSAGFKVRPNLVVLQFADARVTDVGLRELKGLPLHTLRLTNAPVNSAGFEKFKSLCVQELSGGQVTDDGLKGLAELDALNVLDLRDVAS